MKIRTCDAAKGLAMHPAHFLFYVANLDASLVFSDVWPEIDEGWVDTVALASGHRRPPSEHLPKPELASIAKSAISKNAAHVLDKLSRRGKWGNVSVSLDALQNLTHISRHELEDVISELRKASMLVHDGSGRGSISLDPARRKGIQLIIDEQKGRA